MPAGKDTAVAADLVGGPPSKAADPNSSPSPMKATSVAREPAPGEAWRPLLYPFGHGSGRGGFLGLGTILEKCANPSCSHSVSRFLQEGKLIVIEHGGQGRGLEYHWLCTDCSRTMTLRIGSDKTITVVPRIDAVTVQRSA
jgi:hypothetical protein